MRELDAGTRALGGREDAAGGGGRCERPSPEGPLRERASFANANFRSVAASEPRPNRKAPSESTSSRMRRVTSSTESEGVESGTRSTSSNSSISSRSSAATPGGSDIETKPLCALRSVSSAASRAKASAQSSSSSSAAACAARRNQTMASSRSFLFQRASAVCSAQATSSGSVASAGGMPAMAVDSRITRRPHSHRSRTTSGDVASLKSCPEIFRTGRSARRPPTRVSLSAHVGGALTSLWDEPTECAVRIRALRRCRRRGAPPPTGAGQASRRT